MKKLALMTTVAVVALSMPVMAKDWMHRDSNDSNDRHSGMHMDYNNDRYDDTVRLEVRDEPNVQVQTKTTTSVRKSNMTNFTLIDGSNLAIQGEAVYLMTEGGMKYPAPKGAYETQNGFTIFSDDGKFLRAEGPMETVYVDVDDMEVTEVR